MVRFHWFVTVAGIDYNITPYCFYEVSLVESPALEQVVLVADVGAGDGGIVAVDREVGVVGGEL